LSEPRAETAAVRPSGGALALSVLAAVLATVTSLAGIFWSATYSRETPAWAAQGVGQDWANLPVVVALLWSAAILRGRGSLPALGIWLGCLVYFVYAFAIYAFAVHFNALFLAYVAVLGCSFHAMVRALAGLDLAAAAAPLRDHPQRRGAGILLIVIGGMFTLLWLSEDVPHVLSNRPPASLAETALWTNPVHVLDLAIVLPGMIVVGVLLRRQHPLGLLLAAPLLVFAVAMGVAILVLFAIAAARGLSAVSPAAAVIGAIVVLSAVYAWRLLRPHRAAQ
jgi:hypothetical protein